MPTRRRGPARQAPATSPAPRLTIVTLLPDTAETWVSETTRISSIIRASWGAVSPTTSPGSRSPPSLPAARESARSRVRRLSRQRQRPFGRLTASGSSLLMRISSRRSVCMLTVVPASTAAGLSTSVNPVGVSRVRRVQPVVPGSLCPTTVPTVSSADSGPRDTVRAVIWIVNRQAKRMRPTPRWWRRVSSANPRTTSTGAQARAQAPGAMSAVVHRPAAQTSRRTDPGHSRAFAVTQSHAGAHQAGIRESSRDDGCRRPVPASSDGDKVFEAFEGLRSDAFDQQQIVDGGEGLGLSVADDRLGGDRPHARQCLQGGGVGGVEIDLARLSGSPLTSPVASGGGSRRCAVRATGAVRSGLSCPTGVLSVGAGVLGVGAGVLSFLGNVDLLTVVEHSGQIHRIRGGVALEPACGLDGVLDPRSGGERHHRGISHRTGDMDDDLTRRGRRGGPARSRPSGGLGTRGGIVIG